MNSANKKKLIIAIIWIFGLIVGLGIGAYWRPLSGKQTVSTKLFGSVDIRTARLAFNETEHIAELFVQEGDVVKTGEKLATLRTDRLRAEYLQAVAQRNAQAETLRELLNGSRPEDIRSAQASMLASEVRLDKAKHDFDRVQQTVQSGASSQSEFDQLESALKQALTDLEIQKETLALAIEGPREETIEQAKASLEALEAQVHLMEIRLSESVLYAPNDGVIETRILEVGDMASPTQPVYTLALSDNKWIRAYLPEPQLGLLKPGQTVNIFSDSWPGQRFEGSVGYISPIAEFTPKTVQTEDLRTKLVYQVRIWVTNNQDQLRLGMPVTVTFDPQVFPSR